MGDLVWMDPRLLTAEPTEPHVLRWIRESLKPGDTFFDVGAHQGWMSLVAAKRVGRRGKVVAFEPSPALGGILKYHQRVNRMPQLEVVAKAVADVCVASVPFHLVDGGNSYLNSLVGPVGPDVAGDRRSCIQVETVTLDTFWGESGREPTVIKIDVEGAELSVLRGAEALLQACHATLIVAVHPTWMPQGQKAEHLFALLRKHGYRISDRKVVRYEGSDFGDYLCMRD
ncbi:MAG TPA: FkbM family methyltransferase [Terriglobales bacterium]|nr:FkbM family methyltransferase [Terriglobales bacterium]